jgi:hypothetical protein
VLIEDKFKAPLVKRQSSDVELINSLETRATVLMQVCLDLGTETPPPTQIRRTGVAASNRPAHYRAAAEHKCHLTAGRDRQCCFSNSRGSTLRLEKQRQFANLRKECGRLYPFSRSRRDQRKGVALTDREASTFHPRSPQGGHRPKTRGVVHMVGDCLRSRCEPPCTRDARRKSRHPSAAQ